MLTIIKNGIKANFPYTIVDSWNNKVYTSFNDLIALRDDINALLKKQKEENN